MEFETCGGYFLCLCGITVQYKNDIYAIRTCGGTLLQGVLSGAADVTSVTHVSNKQYFLKYLLSFR